MLHLRDGARFSLDVTLGIQAEECNLVFIRPENLVSHGQSPIGALWQTQSGLSFVLPLSKAVKPTVHRVPKTWMSIKAAICTSDSVGLG